jgi:hypothetical protein
MALVYQVKVSNIYGIPSLESELRVYVGTGSTNHTETILKEVHNHFGNSATVTSFVKARPTGRSIGIGKPQSWQDR